MSKKQTNKYYELKWEVGITIFQAKNMTEAKKKAKQITVHGRWQELNELPNFTGTYVYNGINKE